MEDRYVRWRTDTPQRYPHLRSAWRGTVKISPFAQRHGLHVAKTPHDFVVGERYIHLPASLEALASWGYPVAPIIAQCNAWAVTEDGVESLLYPRDYCISWKRLGEDWERHLRGKNWWEEYWLEVEEVLYIARALAPQMLGATSAPARQSHSAVSLPLHRQPVAPSRRFAVLQRDGFRCQICGVTADDGAHVRLEVDHRIPRTRGGTNDLSNLVTLCFACNRGKGTQLLS